MSAIQPLAFIPARAGSKRLPRKNIANLGDRPLLAWTVDAAKEAGIFGDRIWLSSESQDVLDVASRCGARPHRRTARLAGDRVSVEDVARDFAATLDPEARRTIALYIMLPTCPFRSPESIRKAWAQFATRYPEVTALMSVTRLDHPPQWSLRKTGDRIEPTDRRGFDTVRQHLEPAYRHDGGHMITAVPALLQQESVINQRPTYFETPPGEEVDINTPLELEWARFLLTRDAIGGLGGSP